MAAGLPLPGMVWAHGYVQWGGAKVSKSEGTSVSLDEAIEYRGPDALRWFLLREVGFENDGDFSFERFDSRYDGDLANGFGNLAARVTAMIEKYPRGRRPGCRQRQLNLKTEIARSCGRIQCVDQYARAMDEIDLEGRGAEEVTRLVQLMPTTTSSQAAHVGAGQAGRRRGPRRGAGVARPLPAPSLGNGIAFHARQGPGALDRTWLVQRGSPEDSNGSTCIPAGPRWCSSRQAGKPLPEARSLADWFRLAAQAAAQRSGQHHPPGYGGARCRDSVPASQQPRLARHRRYSRRKQRVRPHPHDQWRAPERRRAEQGCREMAGHPERAGQADLASARGETLAHRGVFCACGEKLGKVEQVAQGAVSRP